MIAQTHTGRASLRARRGSTLPVVGILLVMLIGMVAFAIDIGTVAHARTELQATADAGALAGLARLHTDTDTEQDFDAARREVNKFVGGSAGNMPGLTVPDADMQFGYFTPTGAAGSRFSTDLTGRRANALRVTLRRDGATNPRLPLFFGPVIGKADNEVRATATAWAPPALGALPDSELIPYVAHIDHFNAAAGLPSRASNASGFRQVDVDDFVDDWVIGPPGTLPRYGHDGVKELLLFSDTKNAPGNFGSLDLGSPSNGTPELARQLRNGANHADFNIMRGRGKLATDGSLRAPVSLTGDPGISNGVKDDWNAIIGENKIVPLYDTVSSNGNNAEYHVVGFAGVRVVAADLQGNPKRVWVQPTNFYSTRVTGASNGSGAMVGVFAAPRLVIP